MIYLFHGFLKGLGPEGLGQGAVEQDRGAGQELLDQRPRAGRIAVAAGPDEDTVHSPGEVHRRGGHLGQFVVGQGLEQHGGEAQRIVEWTLERFEADVVDEAGVEEAGEQHESRLVSHADEEHVSSEGLL